MKKVCKRCKQEYEPGANSSVSCRFHRSMFVCRRHDDQKRYYELGPDDPPYAAKFFDCCGAEDLQAPGCATAAHISYEASFGCCARVSNRGPVCSRILLVK